MHELLSYISINLLQDKCDGLCKSISKTLALTTPWAQDLN